MIFRITYDGYFEDTFESEADGREAFVEYLREEVEPEDLTVEVWNEKKVCWE